MPSRRSSQTKAVRIRGLTGKQHAFIREKVLGMNDKDAALATPSPLPKTLSKRAGNPECERNLHA
jgi:hypothetical protein